MQKKCDGFPKSKPKKSSILISETKFRNTVLCIVELYIQHKSQSIYYCKHVYNNRVCIAFYLFVYVRRPEKCGGRNVTVHISAAHMTTFECMCT